MDNEKKKKDRKGFKEHDPSKYINTQPVLDEAKKGTAVVAWGRMNPMTAGHEKLIKKVVSVAKSEKGVPEIYLTHSFDKKKNPLAYGDKIRLAQKAFGPIVKKSNAKTIFDLMAQLNKKYNKVILVAGSDRVEEFSSTLAKYNGVEYDFDEIKVVSAGSRDPDSDDVSGISGTKMRSYAATDMNKFKKNLPKNLKRDAASIAKLIKKGMGMSEETEIDPTEMLDEALTRAQRRKRAMAMRRAKARITAGRKRAAKRRATPEQLKGRARKRAIMKLKDKFAKHKRYADLEPAEKERIEKRIAKINKSRIERMATKELIYVKRADRDKFKKVRTESFSQFLEAKMTNPQDPDIKDRPGTQPKPYYKGVAKDKKDDRARHFERNAKKADDDPSAYKPAPGDKEAKTKESKHTKRARAMGYTEEYTWEELTEGLDWVCGQCNCEPCTCEGDGTEPLHEMWGSYVTKRPHMLMDKNNKPKFDKRFKMYKAKQVQESNEFDLEEIVELMESVEKVVAEDAAGKSLKKKAEKSGMPASILRKVYNRGVAAWKGGHRPGTTPEQWGHARVNSFITKSSGTWGKADADLAAKVRKEEVELDEVKRGRSTMDRLKDMQDKSNAMAYKGYKKKPAKKLKDMRKADKSWGKSSAFDYHEEVEQLDELSPRTKASYLKKASAQNKNVQKAYDKSVKSSPDAFFGDDGPEDKERVKIMTKRQKGIAMAKGRKYGQKYESLDDRFEAFLNEVLDTPEKMRAYKSKAKMQSDKARNSATAKIVRGNPDISKEKETIRKREKGLDAADKVSYKHFRKAIGQGYSSKKESLEVKSEQTLDQERKSTAARLERDKLKLSRIKSATKVAKAGNKLAATGDERGVARAKYYADRAKVKSESYDKEYKHHSQGLEAAKADMKAAKTNDDMVKAMNKKSHHSKALSKMDRMQEEGGAGDQGTDKLVKRYKKDTPGC